MLTTEKITFAKMAKMNIISAPHDGGCVLFTYLKGVSYLTRNIHGNLKVVFDDENNYFAYETPSADGHARDWVALFQATNKDELRRLAKQHYCRLSDLNPAKFNMLLAPLTT